MFNNIAYTRKNKLLLPLGCVSLLLCWLLAIRPAYEAICLHSRLQLRSAQSNDLAFNSLHSLKKLKSLNRILKSYRVDSLNWNNELWLKASSLAMKADVGIDFTRHVLSSEKDLKYMGLSQTIYCFGSYKQLVLLIDTLEKTEGIGQISALHFTGRENASGKDRIGGCKLKLEFKGLDY